jgi:peptide/nickel transport system permease protein
MVNSEKVLEIPAVNPPHISEGRRIFKVMFGRWIVVVSSIIILILILVAVFAPLLAPYNPNETHLSLINQAPSQSHRLGTDDLGRDILSRLLYGSRISMLVGIVAVSIGGVLGMGLGLLSGYYGKWIQVIIMRCVDTLMSIPPLILILAIAAVLGAGLYNVLIAIGVGLLPTYARMMNGQILSLKENDYILATRAIGANNSRIMFRHLLPNSFPPLLVLITLNMGTAILMEASLSFLGVGISPPTATWGAMVSGGQTYILTQPLQSFIPGICILLVVLSFNMVGDGLRDALDPRLRGTL